MQYGGDAKAAGLASCDDMKKALYMMMQYHARAAAESAKANEPGLDDTEIARHTTECLVLRATANVIRTYLHMPPLIILETDRDFNSMEDLVAHRKILHQVRDMTRTSMPR